VNRSCRLQAGWLGWLGVPEALIHAAAASALLLLLRR